MNDEKRCEWCRHQRYRWYGASDGAGRVWHEDYEPFCALDRPLKPCEQYEREPGADDD